MAPPYLCELVNKKESHVNTRLGTDHPQLIMPPFSKDCSLTLSLSVHSFMLLHANFDCFRKSVKTMLFTQQYGC